MKKLCLLIVLLGFSSSTMAQQVILKENKWSVEKATNWYKSHQWINGANFIPSTAINQLEMWQEKTFDPKTIDRELSYAQGIGFNTMRVYLHSLAYKSDPNGFKKRIQDYLKIADSHGIKTIFVFFDDVWDANPKIGKQPNPKPGTHNSGWVQDPGYLASKNPSTFAALEVYVKDILSSFKDDERVLLWDLYNEPGNNGKSTSSLDLLTQIFTWAREINPSQPLSVGLWKWDEIELNRFQLANSDIITYHDYEAPEWHLRVVQLLEANGRPMICTEYMARTRNSTFTNTLPMLKEHHVGAINWGLVRGKTNTIYAWDTPIKSGAEPDLWFHDVFREDGTPYRLEEVELIKKLNRN